MLKVISFGEALIDMLSNTVNEPQSSDKVESFTKFPGGAPANVAAAVAKLGGRSYFAGKVGADMFGNFLKDSLSAMGVNTEYLLQTCEAKTALAFVSLDARGERSFEFYRNPSADLLFRAREFRAAWFDEPGIFHFCSNTLTEQSILEATREGIKTAKAAGFLISFDVNLRLNLWPDNADPFAPIWACAEQADLVKLCVEELDFLCRHQSEAEVLQRLLDAGVSLILVTDGGEPLRYFTPSGSGSVLPPKVRMVDSTAAGDAFVGGLLYRLSELDITITELKRLGDDTETLENILRFAGACGAHAVTRKGAFSSLGSLDDLRPILES